MDGGLVGNESPRLQHPLPDAVRTEVVAEFDPEDEGQLALRLGDIVYVLERHESGWWGGHKEGDDTTGWFPSSAVCPTAEDEQQQHEPSSADRSEERQLRDALGTKESRIAELEEKVKSLEAALESANAQEKVRSLEAALESANSQAPVIAAPSGGAKTTRTSSRQPPAPSTPGSARLPIGTAGQPPRTPAPGSAPWLRGESAKRPLAVRALVSEFERRSASRTPGGPRMPDAAVQRRPAPGSRNASVTRSGGAGGGSAPEAQLVSAQVRGRPVEVAEDCSGHGCAEARSTTPVIFGMSPIARAAGRGNASPAQGLLVQDRIRRLCGGA